MKNDTPLNALEQPVESPSDPIAAAPAPLKNQLGWRILAVSLVTMILLSVLAAPLRPPANPLNQGKELYRDGKFEEAASFYRDAIQTHPNDLDISITASTELGRSLLALKRYDEAITLLKQTLQKIPSGMDTWEILGETYTEAHRPQEAVDAFKHVLALEPTRVHTHLMLGQAYDNMGKKAEAKAEWDQVIALDPVNEGQLATKLINLQDRENRFKFRNR